MSVSAICMKGSRLLLRNRPIAPRGPFVSEPLAEERTARKLGIPFAAAEPCPGLDVD
jgi:hypothetical protein